MPLTVKQSGYPDISLTARYASEPFQTTKYYAWRVGYWWHRRGLLLDMTHHKIILLNPPPEIQSFKVTYGYNLITLGPGWRTDHMIYHVGLGIVLANPYSIVRGQERPHTGGMFNEGYFVAGPALVGGMGRVFRIVDRLFVSLDGRVSAAWAQVPVVKGHANAPNVAFHIQAGIGYGFKRLNS